MDLNGRKLGPWKDVNPQYQAPIFRLPSELLAEIWDLTFIAKCRGGGLNFDIRFDHELPGDEGDENTDRRLPARILRDSLLTYANHTNAIGFIGTCRRAYIETSHLAFEHTELWMGEPAAKYAHTRTGEENRETGPGELLTALNKQAQKVLAHKHAVVDRARLFLPTYWVGAFFNRWVRPDMAFRTDFFADEIKPKVYCPRVSVLDNVSYLRLTFRSTDWWHWSEPDVPLDVNPFSPFPISSGMYQGVTPADNEGFLLADFRSWAVAFALMRNLRTIVIDFEGTEDRRAQLERLVDNAANKWQFLVFSNPPPPVVKLDGELLAWALDTSEIPAGRAPWMRMTNPMYRIRSGEPGIVCSDGKPVARNWLTTEGNEIVKMSWRGLPFHWTFKCPDCNTDGWGNKECWTCDYEQRMRGKGKGPRLYSWTVTWTAKPEEPVPPGSAAITTADI